MKKLAAAMLAAILCLVLSWALAESSPVVRSGVLSAYTDGEGHIRLPGHDRPVNRAAADRLISIDAYRLLFTSPGADGASDL